MTYRTLSASPRTSAKDIGLALALALMLAFVGYDLFREIPPVGDDYRHALFGPGELYDHYMRLHWGRPLGLLMLDALHTAAESLGVALFWPTMLVWAASILLVLIVLRRLFELPLGTAYVGAAVFALTPTSTEGWMMVNTAPTALSVPLVVAGAALCARALAATSTRTAAIQLGSAFVISFSAMMLYDQAVLAMPAFVVPLALTEVIRRRVAVGRAAVVAAVACAVVVAWYLEVKLTGVIAARSMRLSGVQASGIDASDPLVALQRLWLGFVMHHAYLAALLARGHSPGAWWTFSLASAVALLATVGAVAATVLLGRMQRPDAPPPFFRRLGWPLVLASVLAAYAAILPIGLAYPGFPLVSRMFYASAAFLAVGFAIAIALILPSHRALVTTGVALYLGWSVVGLRRYLGEARDASMLTREFAREVGRLSAPNPRGILAIGSGVYGTFNTPLIQFWSLRGAVEMLARTQPPPLYFATSCPENRQAAPTAYVDESGHEVSGNPWTAVVSLRGTHVVVGPSVGEVCGSR